MKPVIRGAGGIFKPPTPPTPSTPVEAPNTLRSKSIAEVLALIGEGPIVAPDDLYQQIYLDGVPIKSADGTLNFANVSASISLGYPDQAYIPGTAAAETALSVGIKVTAAAPIVQAITDTTATAARIAVTIPALVEKNPTNGNSSPTSIAFAVDVQPDSGSYTTVVSDSINGKCISPYQADYDIQLPGSGPWNVRVRRLTADSNSGNLLNEIHWTSLSVLRDYRLSYPDSAMLRLRIDAEQFSGSFPTIEYQGKFLISEVPSNYDPVTRTYTGIWDGTFILRWHDNPAWVIWAVKTNDRWGLGRWIDLDAVDKWLLYAASQWFDEMVADGKGGVEPRFTFNWSFDSPAKAYDAITAIVGAVQAMPYWSSGAAHISVDKPAAAVKQVGEANVINGKFVYESSDLATLPTAVHVTWRDPNNGYQRAVEISEDPDKIDRHGWRKKEIALIGCISQGQAARAGRYELVTAWTETEMGAWGVGEDQQDLAPGDIIDVADPSIQGRRMSGRLLAIAGTAVTLDAPVTIASGQTYVLQVPGADGVLQTRSIITEAGETDTLALASEFASPEPITGAVWVLIAGNLVPRKFRAISIEEKAEGGSYGIAAVLHNPAKQGAVESGIMLSLPSVSGYGSGPLSPPISLTINESIERLPSGGYRHRVTLGWAKHYDPRVVRYAVQHKITTDSDYTDDGYALGQTAEIDELGSGGFEFRVRAEAFDGTKSPWSSAIFLALTGLDASPPDVENFTINVLGDMALLAWSPVTAANLSHYEVRYSADGAANWQSMVPIAPRVSGASVQTAARTGIYAVKAQTAQGVQSSGAAVVVSNVSGLSINVVETVDGAPAWDGTLDGLIIDKARNALRLAPDAADFFDGGDFFDEDDFFGTYAVQSSGTFTWADYLDLGEIFICRITAALDVSGERLTDDVWDEPDVWALPTVWGSDPSGWDAGIEVSVTDDDPAAAPTWSDWQRLVVSDLRFRAIRFRLRLTSTDSTVTPIAKARIVIDMPDSFDAGGGVPIDVSGTRVAFTQAFRGPARPSVVITGIEGAAAGDWPDVTNVDRTGFDVVIRNESTPQSGRSIDYHARGYGAVITP